MDLRNQTPRARTDDILVEEVDGETLVYDLKTHDLHCLNPAAEAMLRACDGQTTVADMVPLVAEAGLPQDETVVWMALDRLGRAGLIEAVTLPGTRKSFSRKEVLRVLGLAAGMTLLLPAVDSVVAPLAAAAASCATTCVNGPTCSGLPRCNNKKKCCLPAKKKNKCSWANC